MTVTDNYRFLLLVSVITALFVALLNMLFCEILWTDGKSIPLWGQRSIASYFFSFSIITTFGLVWAVTKATRNALRARKITQLQWHLKSQTLIDRLPRQTIPRSFILAVASSLMTGYILYLLNLKGYLFFQGDRFFYFSTTYFTLQGIVIAVMAIYRAMGDNVYRKAKLNLTEEHTL